MRPHKAAAAAVSIRSPHRSKGRLDDDRLAGSELVVSIRSPHRSKGRLDLVEGIATFQWFQSAPLTEARGDYSSAYMVSL